MDTEGTAPLNRALIASVVIVSPLAGLWARLCGRDEARLAEMTERFAGDEIPLPPHWGGYRVRPDMIEFWQGRPNRLHDRFRYLKKAGGSWKIERLAP